MPFSRLVRSAASGALLVNAVPHGVAAVQGRPFPSPFASPPGIGLSAPLVNVAWSAANAIGGAALRVTHPARSERIAAAVGGIAMALVVAAWFGGRHGERGA